MLNLEETKEMKDTIFTYGGGSALEMVLNGVAMIMNNGLGNTIVSFMTVVAICWAAIQGIMQQSFLPKINWLVKYTLITTLLITPKSSVWIYDSVYQTRHKVDNLPIGLVIPATLFSTLGFGVTKTFEQAFATVDDISYSKYGTSFGAGMIANARNYRIQDADFRENMNSFIDNCVLYDVMIGHKYSPSEMRNATELWNLISSTASNIKMFNYREGKTRSLETCKAGSAKLEAYWKTDMSALTKRFTGSIFSTYGGTTTGASAASNKSSASSDANKQLLGQAFLNNLGVVTSFYGNKSGASANLKQLMMINAMSDMPSSYGALRAKQQQKESWQVTGELAREYLPIMHSVFAGLIYASFILILGLLVLPGGFRVFGSYLGLLAWIELWPPLFAVLNMIVNLSSKMAGGQIGTGFTMNNISQMISNQSNISALAGYFMISIPFIALTIIKGGASQFMHLAGQLTSATQSAATGAASEVTSGNRNFDNHSLSGSQMFNNNGFKTDLNASYRTGQQDHQLADGTNVRTMASGGVMFNSGPGITTSTGSKQMSMSTVDTSATHRSLGEERSNLNSKSMEYAGVRQQAIRTATELVARIAAGESSGVYYDYGESTSESKQLQDAVHKTKELHEEHGSNWRQSATAVLSGSGALAGAVAGNLSSGGGKGGGANASATATLTGTVTGTLSGQKDASRSTDQSLAEKHSGGRDKRHIEGVDNIIKGAKEVKFNTNQSEEKSLSDSLNASFEKMSSLKIQQSVSQQNIERYQSSLEQSNAQSFSVSDEMYHKELTYIAHEKDRFGFEYGFDKAHKLMEDGGSSEYKNLHAGFINKHVEIARMPSNGNSL
ncbi:MAG: hypothetical protein RIT35_754, partial [Pseudomonadota bacterium]